MSRENPTKIAIGIISAIEIGIITKAKHIAIREKTNFVMPNPR